MESSLLSVIYIANIFVSLSFFDLACGGFFVLFLILGVMETHVD